METIGFHAKHMKTPRMAHVRLPKLGHLPGLRSCHEGRKSAPLDCVLSARQKMLHQFQFLRAGIVRTGLSILKSCGTPCAPSSRRTIDRRSVSVTSTAPSTRRGGSLMAYAIFVRCPSPPSQASIHWNIRRKVFLPDVKETVKNFCHHRSFGFVSCDADDGDIWFAAASVEGVSSHRPLGSRTSQ